MIHAVWGTKNHYHFLTSEIEENVREYIEKQEEHHKIFLFSRSLRNFLKKVI
jgi:hypothetical protein